MKHMDHIVFRVKSVQVKLLDGRLWNWIGDLKLLDTSSILFYFIYVLYMNIFC